MIILTPIIFGMKDNDARKIIVPFCALESKAYKLVLGMDVLSQMHAKIDVEHRFIHMTDTTGR